MTDVQMKLLKWEKRLEKFLGFNIKLEAENDEIKNLELQVEIPNTILKTQTAALSDLIDRMGNTLKRKGLGEIEFYQYDSIIEEVALNFIIIGGRGPIKQNMFEFVEDLKELSHQTYEKAPSQLSFTLKDDNTMKYIQEKGMTIVEFDTPISVEGLILEDKKSLKLIDGLSLSLLLNEEYKVVGVVKKKFEGKDIRNTILEERDFEKALMKKITLESLAENGIQEVDKKRLSEITKQMSDMAVEMIQRTRFIEIRNQSINWYMTPSVFITSKNGKWSYKNFYILKGFLLEQLYIKKVEKKEEIKEEELEGIIEKVSFFVEALKNLSDNNIGSLFVFLNNGKKMDTYTSESKNMFKDIIKEENNHINIGSCDKYLFQLISGVDGAVFMDRNFNIEDFGRLIDTSKASTADDKKKEAFDKEKESIVEQGARTAAAKKISHHGLAIKISEDGGIKVYEDGEIKLRI